MHTERYPYPLCISWQPRSLDAPEFLDTLNVLKDSGFYGDEMNLLDFSPGLRRPAEKRRWNTSDFV